MGAFYTASLAPKTSVIQGTCDIWRANNLTNRLNLDANKLANIRRDIVNKERLTKMELQAIQGGVKQRDENAKSNERDANADPEEQIEDRTHENEQNHEPGNHEPLKKEERDEKYVWHKVTGKAGNCTESIPGLCCAVAIMSNMTTADPPPSTHRARAEYLLIPFLAIVMLLLALAFCVRRHRRKNRLRQRIIPLIRYSKTKQESDGEDSDNEVVTHRSKDLTFSGRLSFGFSSE
ncbi:hypothetical protein GJAV_G00159430 [Gymnothorax javanicus]|nr:hypothetical protein GJAV_G00159430 [Gymnothorax javanicus]